MPPRRIVIALLAVLALGLAAVGALVYWALGPTLAASGPITAIPVLGTATPPAAASAPATTGSPAAATAVPQTVGATPLATSGLIVFQITAGESEARFILSEELRGQPTTVIGATRQVAGEIAVDPADLVSARVGVIQINARTLATESNQRNRAIRNFILETDQYEFITFTPAEVRGLSGAGAPGGTFTFQVAGDLTIRDVTRPVVFDVTVTADAANRLSGTAATVVNRGDFSLAIPSVPQVANVSEAVRLEFDFVALAS
jgi:polyisoprenoid-binding protein YceI